MKLVTKAHQVFENMENLSHELARSPELADRLGLVHAWYIDARDTDHPIFGFSKFIGYEAITADTYLEEYKNLNGRNTEWALKEFCEELHPESRQYGEYHEKLADWLAEFGKTPRNPVRLMILKSNPENASDAEDRRLLELLAAVADLLPLWALLLLLVRDVAVMAAGATTVVIRSRSISSAASAGSHLYIDTSRRCCR
jgi:hypothetical protein